MNYSMIALDMDGTLLNGNLEIHPDIIESIHNAKGLGKEIVVATGRSLSEFAQYKDQLKDVRYMILESGAIVYDCEEEKIVFSKTLEEKTIRQLMDLYHKKDVMIHIFSNAYSYIEKCKLECLENYQMELFRDTFVNHCRTFDDVDTFIEEHLHVIEKINFYHSTTEDQLDSKEQLKDVDITKVLLSGVSIEMNEKDVHKALGINKLCEHLNISVKDVIAVGDSDNDLEILEAVGLAVAMGNANERVKKIANVIVSDNEHCGVKEAIDKYLLNK